MKPVRLAGMKMVNELSINGHQQMNPNLISKVKQPLKLFYILSHFSLLVIAANAVLPAENLEFIWNGLYFMCNAL